jgi:hypothetical protein
MRTATVEYAYHTNKHQMRTVNSKQKCVLLIDTNKQKCVLLIDTNYTQIEQFKPLKRILH